MSLKSSFVTLSAVTAILAACAAQQDIVKSIPDVAGCAEKSIEAWMSGTPDIAGLIQSCGATLSDIEKVIADLKAKQADAGTVGVSPQIAAWEKAVADYKAAHPGAK